MKLSKRGEYGLKALIDLASQENPQTLVQIKDIAQRQQIPVKFLEQIMLAMKNGGILHSRAGVGGGYYLAKPVAEITLGQVVRLLDGPLAPISCVSQMAYERCICEDEATCGLRLAMLDVRNAIADILDKTTLADVSTRVERAQRAEKRSPRQGTPHRAAKAKPAARVKR
jgi:Rrf2 family protein